MIDIEELPKPPLEGSLWGSEPNAEWTEEPPFENPPPWGITGEELKEANDGSVLKISYEITSSAHLPAGFSKRSTVYDEIIAHRCWLETPDGEEIEIPYNGYDRDYGSNIAKLVRRAELWVEIWNQTGGTKIVENEDIIPVDVAMLGKPSIAAYLYSVHGLSPWRIAKRFDYNKNTIRKYITRFDRGKREVLPEYEHWV